MQLIESVQWIRPHQQIKTVAWTPSIGYRMWMTRDAIQLHNKAPTIETVANRAGVSTMTVSRVLRGTNKVADSTRQRVESAMRELGYVHNRIAGTLAAQRSAQIAVIVPTLRNAFFGEVLAGIAEALDGTGFEPVVGVAEYDNRREYELLHSMMGWRPAAAILANLTHHKDTVRILTNAAIPVVEVMALRSHPIDMTVGLDHTAAGSVMAKHLLDSGYKRFAYLGADHAMDKAAGQRFEGFSTTLSDHSINIIACSTHRELAAIKLGRQHTASLLESAPEAEVIYCSNDSIAAGVMMHCQANGIRIPEDLGIASFGGTEISTTLPVELTTIKTPLFDIGKQSVEQVLKRLQGVSTPVSIDAGFEIVVGGSTRNVLSL